MRNITKNQRIVRVDDVKFTKAIETEEHIYFVDENEGDENANTLMYSKINLSLISNNHFANGSIIEDILNGNATKIVKSFQYNYNEILKNKDTY